MRMSRAPCSTSDVKPCGSPLDGQLLAIVLGGWRVFGTDSVSVDLGNDPVAFADQLKHVAAGNTIKVA